MRTTSPTGVGGWEDLRGMFLFFYCYDKK
jgi:hypothetical protein